MAGIAGIYYKSSFPRDYEPAVLSMLDSIGHIDANHRVFCQGRAFYGIKGMINSHACKAYSSHDNKVNCIVDGNVFIDSNLHRESDLPRLYLDHGDDLVHFITGWYNVFLYDNENNRCLLFTSRFGMLPLFIYEDDDIFVFCSKVKGLIASRLFEAAWDKTTQLEHAIFNYPLTEHTFLKSVSTALPACCYEFSGENVQRRIYWQFDQLLDRAPLSKRQSIDLLNETLQRTVKKLTSTTEPYGLSLTGGWDGRLILSYALRKNEDKFFLYSFGSNDSPDISIPTFISNKLGISYIPFILDGEYIEDHFLVNAKDTICFSSGYRNYLRSHYMFAMKNLAFKTKYVLSGNCGSNLLKFSEIVPGAVLSPALIELIKSSFSLDGLSIHIKKYNSIMRLAQKDIDELYTRIGLLKEEALNFGRNRSSIYFYLLLMKVERKFFGSELSSYNDYVFNFSPFIDFDFIDNLAKTIYWGTNFEFNSHSNKLKINSFDLYKSLMIANYPKLCEFKTDRGFSLKRLNRIDGKLLLLAKRLFTKISVGQHQDAYNTGELYLRFLKTTNFEAHQLDGLEKNETANILSTFFFGKNCH